MLSIKALLQEAPVLSTTKQADEHQTFLFDVKPDTPDEPEKTAYADMIAELLKAIGMKCFVTWYPLFANKELAVADIIEQLHTHEGYTEKSCRSRLSKARKIINDGLNISALNMIIASERVNDSLRDEARKLLGTLTEKR